MKVIKALLVLAVIVIVGIGVYDGVQPTIAEKDARSAATDVAQAAARKLCTERADPKPFSAKTADARNAAVKVADADSVSIIKFTIEPTTNIFHVTIVKEAKSILIKHIRAWRHYDEITVSESASPSCTPTPPTTLPGKT